jgi:glycosyltransferase involved in cell wall biosynthesis
MRPPAAMTLMPMLSVIIPCHNNGRTLGWALRAIRACSLDNVEIICVDDHSTDDIEPIARQHGALYERIASSSAGNRARVRQKGHQLATGTVTFYLDGDIIPEPRVFVEAVRLHTRHPCAAIKFPVYSIPQMHHCERLAELAMQVVAQDFAAVASYVQARSGADTFRVPRRLQNRLTNMWMGLASNCMSVERRSIQQIGGWDETFCGWGEEDMELAYRLHLAGLRFLYPHREHGAAYHLDHPVEWSANLASLDRNLEQFLRKFPEAWPSRRPFLRRYLRENGMPDVAAMAHADRGDFGNQPKGQTL